MRFAAIVLLLSGGVLGLTGIYVAAFAIFAAMSGSPTFETVQARTVLFLFGICKISAGTFAAFCAVKLLQTGNVRRISSIAASILIIFTGFGLGETPTSLFLFVGIFCAVMFGTGTQKSGSEQGRN